MPVVDNLFIHKRKDVNIAYDIDFAPGIPTTFRLSVNYALWFSNVDVEDKNSFEISIENGVSGSFYKTP